MLLFFQLLANALALALVPLMGSVGRGPLRHCSRAFARLACRRRAAVALVGAVAFLNTLWLARCCPPLPCAHDEFSYLLAADTFASGRLTNPTHPMWRHFESFHVLQEPTYQSKFPPLQGLVLALGIVLAGTPVAGLCLAQGAACACSCWMFQQYVPPRWALLGGLLLAFHPFLTGVWGGIFWGGAAAMAGGALVAGAVRRLARAPRAGDAVALGVGLAVLANTRPYEGLVASLPVAALLAVRLARGGRAGWGPAWRRFVLPTGGVLAASAALMGYYNYKVTGDALLLPYVAYHRTYVGHLPFVWDERVKFWSGNFSVQRADAAGEADLVPLVRHDTAAGRLAHFARRSAGKLVVHWAFYFSVVYSLPLLMLPWVLRDRWMRFLLLICAAVMAAVLLTEAGNPHYSAPAAAPAFLLAVQGLRHLRAGRRWVGRALFWAACLGGLGALFLVAADRQAHGPPYAWARDRARLQAELERAPGRDLILVRYSPGHSPHTDWVYNRADIDGSAVVWARELSPGENGRLLAYFPGRRVWLLEADTTPPRVTPVVTGRGAEGQ